MSYNVDPVELIKQIRGGRNPQQLMLSILESQAATNPIYANLRDLAREGRTVEIEAFARNLAKEQGIDFDKEFSLFKKKYFGL